MISEISYICRCKLLCISYRNANNVLCREVQLPSSDRKFAKSIISDFNKELAIEIYKLDILC